MNIFINNTANTLGDPLTYKKIMKHKKNYLVT